MKPPRFFKRVQAATPEDIMMALADFATQVPGDQEIVEIGVFHGRTALQLAWGARQGQGAHVTAIDLWDLQGNTYGPPFTDSGTRRWAAHHVQSLGYSKDITLVQGFSHEVAAGWDGKPVGLIFIDGDHSKEGARLDIESWAPLLAPGARIAVDDYDHPDWPGVREALEELIAEGFVGPVEVFHDRLAVTRLVEVPPVRAVVAITGEGVSTTPTRADLEAEWERIDPEGVAALRESAAELDRAESRMVVQFGELGDVESGTPIGDLNLVNLKALAKHRGIVLGARKDKRDLILDALRSGK